MRLDFVATFTGQLSTIQGFSLHPAKVRVEQGHVYRLLVNEATGQCEMRDFGSVAPAPDVTEAVATGS